MRDILDATDLRRWATQCAAQATDIFCISSDHERLMTIRQSLLALADNADWLAGKPASTSAPDPGEAPLAPAQSPKAQPQAS
jgi:hypothetical protein